MNVTFHSSVTVYKAPARTGLSSTFTVSDIQSELGLPVRIEGHHLVSTGQEIGEVGPGSAAVQALYVAQCISLRSSSWKQAYHTTRIDTKAKVKGILRDSQECLDEMS